MVSTMYRYGTRCPFPGFWEQRTLEEHSPCYSLSSLAELSQREGMLQGWDGRKTLPLLEPSCHALHPHHKKMKKKKIRIAILHSEYHFLSQIFALPCK